MQGMTDEQYKEVFIAAISAFNDVLGASKSVEKARTASGRAAVEKAAPDLLAEPTPKELRAADKGPGQPWQETVQQAFANRLAQYTAKPDPRVEAAIEAMKPWANHNCSDESMKLMRKAAQDVVAAIDAAGGKQ